MKYLFLFYCLFANAQTFQIGVNNQSMREITLCYTDKHQPYLLDVLEKKWVLHKGFNQIELPTYKNAVYNIRYQWKENDLGKNYPILPQNKEILSFNIDKKENISIKSNQSEVYPLIEKAPNLYEKTFYPMQEKVRKGVGVNTFKLIAKQSFEKNMEYYTQLKKNNKLPLHWYQYYQSCFAARILYQVFVVFNEWDTSFANKKELATAVYQDYFSLVDQNISNDFYFLEQLYKMVYHKYIDLDLPKNNITDWSKFSHREHYVYFQPNDLEIALAIDLHYGLREPVYSGSVSERLYQLLLKNYPNSLYIQLYKAHYDKGKN